MTNTATMDKDKPPEIKRNSVFNKLSRESISVIERGLLGELPVKLRPTLVRPTTLVRAEQVRSRRSNVIVEKQPGIISSCLSPIQDYSDADRTSSEEEDSVSPLKKSFSFRERLSRMNIFGRDKEKDKAKLKKIAEDKISLSSSASSASNASSMEREKKSRKRFWLFRQKDLDDNKERRKIERPAYMRSKSFEFLPRAAKEKVDELQPTNLRKNCLSFIYNSSDALADEWADISYDKDDGVFLQRVKEFPSLESNTNSTMSTETSSSGIVFNLLKSESMENVLKEFDKAVETFSENYVSDCETYTKCNDLTKEQKRKSSSFSALPSPKVLQVNKVFEVSEDFKKELSMMLIVKQGNKTCRRGSVTDCFLLEGKKVASNQDKYRRALKKPTNRVRRMSSTKYWITPEECAEYSRDARPPLVIPRISQYRQPRIQRTQHPYVEDTIQESTPVRPLGRPYERLQDWSPTSERGRAELERSFSKASSDSPPIARINKRLGNSTENLLYPNVRRPNNLHLPASSSGDSLDVEIREREPGHVRSRKSRSMVQPKHRMRSPVPAPRMLIPQQSEMPVVYEGAVKRTKFSENGKKSKKNWSDCYVVLTQTGLIFYKDQKTYYASKAPKPAGSPPSPTAPRAELVLPLRHASVDFCMQMHTRRYTRSLLISVGRDQYLLQDDTDKGAEKWLFNIKTIIHKLGPPLPDDLSVNQLRNSNTDLESLGRTPPPLRHNNRGKKQVGGSSNEDLSDTTEVSIQKSHVKSRLKKFFAKRPAMEVLVKKGIYKDEPVFGRKLDEVCPTEKGVPRVPNFVVACIKEIESSEENMCTDGLYRASGNLSQVQRIRLQVDQNDLGAIENSSDIHVLTGSLKLFFRELKEPLIPCALFDRVLAACSIKPREAKIKEFRDIIQALPQCNRETLKYLLEHLLRVTQYSEHNRMHTANLAIVFGPTLLWAPAEQAHNIAIDCIQQNNVVEVLLNDFKEIFAEDTKTKKKA
ncbi:rho GTPase-activating protein 9-like isoform X3 [Plodia interpunctella]|uniref:rho GTPase-activating protein 9-like isoform X3 n=1 Tax=Plodia interpunctella TaxID=58824 RepID=UPI002367E6FC|nr:rho GTPase-activating protein 9-like isoform X3 [Plodia interpunctella]